MPTAHPKVRFTLRQLQYFAAAARVGQVSLAAVECHVSQSTMTSAIAELERSLGASLFERTRSGVNLTYQGHLFLQHAETVLEAADEAARQPFLGESAVAGVLNLAASYTLLGYYLLPFVATFWAPGLAKVPYALALFSVFCMYVGMSWYSPISPLFVLLHPVATLLLGYTMMRSMFHALRNDGIVWRGTRYPLEQLKSGLVKG